MLLLCSLGFFCLEATQAPRLWHAPDTPDYHIIIGKTSVLSAVCLFLQSKRGARDGNDTESADEQTGSPLHVLSDIAQREGELEARPEAAANGADSELSPRMQTRSGDSAAAGEGRSAPARHVQCLQQPASTAGRNRPLVVMTKVDQFATALHTSLGRVVH